MINWGGTNFNYNNIPIPRLIEILKPLDPIAEKMEKLIQNDPKKAEFVRRALINKCRKLQIDPNDPMHPYPDKNKLGSDDGIYIANATDVNGKFYQSIVEAKEGGFLFCGSPGGGKTTAVCSIIRTAQKKGIGVLVPCDVRGDYIEKLAADIPNALIIPDGKILLNPLNPPPGVALRQWLFLIAGRLTYDFGLLEAGMNYLVRLFNELAEICEQKNTIPALPDLLHLLKNKNPNPRSSEAGYRERLLVRFEGLMYMANGIFDIKKGYPVIEEVENKRLVIVHSLLDKAVVDFIISNYLYYLYMKRLHSIDPFNHPLVFVVLDEARSLIRKQQHDGFIPDIELLFSRSRALKVSFLVGEQLISQVSPAVVTSTKVRLAFNTTPPEDWFVARALGLNPLQQAELSKLAPGEAIARVAGDRIPGPFRVKIPYPD